MIHRMFFWTLAAVIASAPAAWAQTITKPALTLAAAKQVLAATISKAEELKSPGGTIAIVDDGGHLIVLERLDGTFVASANISIGKARTAAIFKKPTKVFEGIVNQGRTTMVTLPDFTPLQGGVPLTIDGHVVGAIGVSGAASADQDEELAQAGAAAFSAQGEMKKTSATTAHADAVQVFGADEVEKAWGSPLLETGRFKIHASHRDAAGMAEVHDFETDIGYVVSGSATLVTGGQMIDGQMTAAGETRGSGIDGGQVVQLTAGDIFVIPNGTPHWFQQVDGPFRYFVVKPIVHDGE